MRGYAICIYRCVPWTSVLGYRLYRKVVEEVSDALQISILSLAVFIALYGTYRTVRRRLYGLTVLVLLIAIAVGKIVL